jgi:hypothetical protein
VSSVTPARAEQSGRAEGFGPSLDALNAFLAAHPSPVWAQGEGLGSTEKGLNELCLVAGYRFRSGTASSFYVHVDPPPGVDVEAAGVHWSMIA